MLFLIQQSTQIVLVHVGGDGVSEAVGVVEFFHGVAAIGGTGELSFCLFGVDVLIPDLFEFFIFGFKFFYLLFVFVFNFLSLPEKVFPILI